MRIKKRFNVFYAVLVTVIFFRALAELI